MQPDHIWQLKIITFLQRHCHSSPFCWCAAIHYSYTLAPCFWFIVVLLLLYLSSACKCCLGCHALFSRFCLWCVVVLYFSVPALQNTTELLLRLLVVSISLSNGTLTQLQSFDQRELLFWCIDAGETFALSLRFCLVVHQ